MDYWWSSTTSHLILIIRVCKNKKKVYFKSFTEVINSYEVNYT